MESFVDNPLRLVHKLFEENYLNNPEKKPDIHGDWGIPQYFESNVVSNWDKIPLLTNETLDSIRSGSLVRYRGMIQDVFDPEFFLGVYEEFNTKTGERKLATGKYQDAIETKDVNVVDSNSSSSVPLDRLPLYCIPIPAATSWTQPRHVAPTPPQSASSSSNKRKSPEEELTDSIPVEETSEPLKTRKKHQNDSTDSKANRFETVDSSYFPVPESQGMPCLVHAYHSTDTFKVNQVIDFVGILSLTPTSVEFDTDPSVRDALMDIDEEETKAHNPPSSLVPRLHCLFVRPVKNLDMVLPPQMTSQAIDILRKDGIPIIRKELIDYIAHCVGGDNLAAEYILLNMLSRVYRRHETMALGNLSLNLTKCPQGNSSFRAAIQSLFHSLLPKSYYLPLTIDNLCQRTFVPRKDYTKNRLMSGMLQLSDGTHLIADETMLEGGKLEAQGTRHLQALGNVITYQKVEYDFQFHSLDFFTDIPVVILSEGRSLITCLAKVPLQPQEGSTFSWTNQEDQLLKFRVYLSALRALESNLSEGISERMQGSFVAMRKTNPQITQDSFHLWLTLARLQALSFGEEEVSPGVWDHTLQLEQQRLSRLDVPNAQRS